MQCLPTKAYEFTTVLIMQCQRQSQWLLCLATQAQSEATHDTSPTLPPSRSRMQEAL
jgi:hypothetical protein